MCENIQPSAPSAVLDLGFDDEIEETEEKKEEVEINHQSHRMFLYSLLIDSTKNEIDRKQNLDIHIGH